MARKVSLRDFQEYLSGRLKTAAQGKGTAAWLGVEAGQETWLVDLSDSGEVVQAPVLMAVPLTQPWFAGLANIRGNLHAVTDLSAFRGGPLIPQNANARLLLVGTKFGANSALLVSRMLGLKNPENFAIAALDETVPAWAAARYTDAHGQVWRKLSVRDLLADQDFMNIGV